MRQLAAFFVYIFLLIARVWRKVKEERCRAANPPPPVVEPTPEPEPPPCHHAWVRVPSRKQREARVMGNPVVYARCSQCPAVR